MAKLHPFEPQVRFINGIQIWWKDRHTIVVSQGFQCVMIHRWFDRQRGRYTPWKRLCLRLKRRNNIKSLYQIVDMANEYDIDHQSVTSTIKSLPPKGIKVLPEHYDWSKEKKLHLH